MSNKQGPAVYPGFSCADPRRLTCLQTCPWGLQFIPTPARGSSSSWGAYANTPPASAKVKPGEPYLINPACSDTSRLRGAPVGRSRGAVTFFTAIAVCKRVSVHVLYRATGLREGLCFQAPSLWKHSPWVFNMGKRRGVSYVLRDDMFLLSVWWEISRLSPSLMGGYWRFGWKENLNLKNVLTLLQVLADVGLVRSSRLQVLVAEWWDT